MNPIKSPFIPMPKMRLAFRPSLRFFKRQSYYSLIPILWKAHFCGKGEWLFDCLQFRVHLSLYQLVPCP